MKKRIKVGDYITNIGDTIPTFIARVDSIGSRSYLREISVTMIEGHDKVKRRVSQTGMPEKWTYPLDFAHNLFRTLTATEVLLYIKDDI